MAPGQSILITGATSGIGRDAALRLAAAGHLVLAGGRRADALAVASAHGITTSVDAAMRPNSCRSPARRIS